MSPRSLLTLALLLSAAPVAARAADDAGTAPEAPRPEQRPSDRAWSLSVGTGFGGFFDFADGLGGFGPTGYERTRERRRQLDLRLDRQLGRRVRAGLAYMYIGWTDDFSSGAGSVGTIDERAQVLMADVTVRWYRGEHVETYSAVAAGYGYWRATGTVAGSRYQDTQAGPAFQISYFGLSVGNERLRAFAELGIGFEGLIVAGATVRL